MAGRPLRQNKALPESPKIVAAVAAALAKLRGGGKELIIPWEDFVFSTREGKPYMPPTLAEGIRRVKRRARNVGELATPKGVRLRVTVSPFGEYSGSFFPEDFTLSVSPDRPSVVIRHELIHFVQEVGSALIRVKEGRPGFMTADEVEHPPGEHYHTPSVRFGLPKKAIQTRDTWTTFGDEPVEGEHGRQDPEHYANAMSLALFGIQYAKEAGKGRTTPERVAKEIVAHAGQFTLLFDVPEAKARELGLPEKLRMPGVAREVALKRAAWEYAANELGMSGEMPASVAKILGISARKVRAPVVPSRPPARKLVAPTPARKPVAPAPKAPAMLRVEQREDGWYVAGKRFGSQKAATLEYIRQLGG